MILKFFLTNTPLKRTWIKMDGHGFDHPRANIGLGYPETDPPSSAPGWSGPSSAAQRTLLWIFSKDLCCYTYERMRMIL